MSGTVRSVGRRRYRAAGEPPRPETSPYLRQHADNPVDWYPWGDEAFAAARASDVPILLSVGYSACHWCHVMAHESFEDATAAVMNELFVNIKVDREERPDVDAVYMERDAPETPIAEQPKPEVPVTAQPKAALEATNALASAPADIKQRERKKGRAGKPRPRMRIGPSDRPFVPSR